MGEPGDPIDFTKIFSDLAHALKIKRGRGIVKILRIGIYFFLLWAEAEAATLNLASRVHSYVRLGRESAESQVFQSFTLTSAARIEAVTLAVARRGNPVSPITVAIRDTLNGPDLASAIVQPSLVNSLDPFSPTNITVAFPSVSLGAGARFLTVSSALRPDSGSNHYYLSLGSYSGGVLTFKGYPHSLDLVGSVDHSSTAISAPLPPPPPPTPFPPPPPPPLSPTHDDLEGFGLTNGGAGGEIYRVTSLRDSGPGSLRDAVSRGNRSIVFDVAGEIFLERPLEVKEPFITVDGSTAPRPGITLHDFGIMVHGVPKYIRGARSHDVIIRGIRIRNAHGDGIQIAWGAYNVVVDHVSVSGSSDGNIDITHGAHDVTVSWSIMGNAEKNQLVKPMAGTDITPALERISLHHNLYANSGDRNPRISNGLGNTGRPAGDITADVRNNVIANWRTGIASDAECGAKVNFVGNFYSAPTSQLSDKRQAIIVRGRNAAGADYAGCHTASGDGIGALAHVEGNVSGDDLSGSWNINSNATYIKHNQSVPFPAAEVTTTDACSAALEVLAGAGVQPLDAVDSVLISNVSLGRCGS
jgi:hypothetical protein